MKALVAITTVSLQLFLLNFCMYFSSATHSYVLHVRFHNIRNKRQTKNRFINKLREEYIKGMLSIIQLESHYRLVCFQKH
jgi:hypothetical protein